MAKITLTELRDLLQKKEKKKKRPKYNAVRQVKQGIKFDSKLEASFFQHLVVQKNAGIIKFFLRQTPFHLPGNVKYLCDFVIFYPCGRVRYIDIKGVMTAMSTLKIKQVCDLYPIEIEILTREDLRNLEII